MKEKESFAKRGQNFHEQEKVTRGELDAASELLNTAYANSNEVLASVSIDKGSIRGGDVGKSKYSKCKD